VRTFVECVMDAALLVYLGVCVLLETLLEGVRDLWRYVCGWYE
jgi:hypothetical protein